MAGPQVDDVWCILWRQCGREAVATSFSRRPRVTPERWWISHASKTYGTTAFMLNELHHNMPVLSKINFLILKHQAYSGVILCTHRFYVLNNTRLYSICVIQSHMTRWVQSGVPQHMSSALSSTTFVIDTKWIDHNVVCHISLLYIVWFSVGVSWVFVFITSPPSAAYMHKWIGSVVVQIMGCRLLGAKPLSKSILCYWQF